MWNSNLIEIQRSCRIWLIDCKQNIKTFGLWWQQFKQFDNIFVLRQASDENLKIFAHRNACSVCQSVTHFYVLHITKFKQFTYLWLWSVLFTEILYAIQLNSMPNLRFNVYNAAFIHCVLCKFPTCQNQEQSSTHFHNTVCSRSAFIPLCTLFTVSILSFSNQ